MILTPSAQKANPSLTCSLPGAWRRHYTWPPISADVWEWPPHNSSGSDSSEQLSKWPVRAQGPGATSVRGLQI